ncbi:hypothetical protein A5724_30815 [Mycobacterium sp. ACS1612]|uniref:enoyl-CoA hydratase/isomerase family protein n=1 Tax=Mycobacterium sp. ACS1612 TaxID=1834117 RepID=UPI000800680D|nr:enoyl-CoA hydratase/isomerase family protein [Mycobacterium sp. ACS1612]OBF26761.1 hypothetical protein A5724_30815 [Mycobacterium sp. ACS1612]
MTNYEDLEYDQRGPVTVITINRPERMKAIGPQTHSKLVDARGRFRDDDAPADAAYRSGSRPNVH